MAPVKLRERWLPGVAESLLASLVVLLAAHAARAESNERFRLAVGASAMSFVHLGQRDSFWKYDFANLLEGELAYGHVLGRYVEIGIAYDYALLHTKRSPRDGLIHFHRIPVSLRIFRTRLDGDEAGLALRVGPFFGHRVAPNESEYDEGVTTFAGGAVGLAFDYRAWMSEHLALSFGAEVWLAKAHVGGARQAYMRTPLDVTSIGSLTLGVVMRP